MASKKRINAPAQAIQSLFSAQSLCEDRAQYWTEVYPQLEKGVGGLVFVSRTEISYGSRLLGQTLGATTTYQLGVLNGKPKFYGDGIVLPMGQYAERVKVPLQDSPWECRQGGVSIDSDIMLELGDKHDISGFLTSLDQLKLFIATANSEDGMDFFKVYFPVLGFLESEIPRKDLTDALGDSKMIKTLCKRAVYLG